MTCKQPHEIEFWTLKEKNDMQKSMIAKVIMEILLVS
jgi:hypothetical protein